MPGEPQSFVKPGKATYRIELRPKQSEFFYSTQKLCWFVGGVGSGKTSLGSLFALDQARTFPKAMGFIGANTYRQLHNSTLPPFFTLLNDLGMPYVFSRRPRPEWNVETRFERHDGIISLANGAQIFTYSLENPEAYRGIQIAWFWVDETSDAKPEALSILFERLRGYDSDYPGIVYKGRFTGTPNGFDAMYDMFVGQHRLPDTHYVQAPTASNAANLPPGYVADLGARLGKKLAQQQLEADFVSLTQGKMFDFNRARNAAPCKYNEAYPLAFSQDFNVAPMAGIVLQFADNKIWVFDEIHIPDEAQTRVACEEFARRWKGADLIGGKSRRKVLYWGDRAGVHRDTRGNVSDLEIMEQTLREHFVSVSEGCDRAQRLIVDGVNAVNAMLYPLRGEPKLIINPACEMLIQDLEQMAWKPGTKQPDESDKQRKHFSDCLRYPVAQLYPVQGTIEDRNWAKLTGRGF